ncbi:hypothetical protein [Cupriavidus sp. D39]|uniref:hypothetical protein n=1 Tax=Cupriavidus sp. D39 TaxID=2997877 RepID=UPI00226DC4AB|nr:hypothetical protein [Cupriavidus sp. D39]MCY0854003.1 hypothetical protein [Cupriavidus sp. D39]
MTKSAAQQRRRGKTAAVLPITFGLSSTVLLNIQLKARLALDAYRQGTSSLEDRVNLDTLFVVGLVLASEHALDVGSSIEHSRRILLDYGSFTRQEQEGVPTNEQFAQLSDALSYCEALLETSTRRKVRDAILEALRIQSKRTAG